MGPSIVVKTMRDLDERSRLGGPLLLRRCLAAAMCAQPEPCRLEGESFADIEVIAGVGFQVELVQKHREGDRYFVVRELAPDAGTGASTERLVDAGR